MRRPDVFLPLLASLVAAGCGPSQAAKEEAAVARMLNRPKAGFVRVVNLSAAPLPVQAKGRPIMAEVPAGGFSRLVAFAAGKGVVNAGSTEVGLDLKPGEGTTVVVIPSMSPETITGEVRTPGTSNVRIVIAKGDGSASFPASGLSVAGPAASKIDADTKSLNLAEGEYRVGEETVKIEPKCAYTFLIVPYKKNLRVFPMLNTPNDRPAGIGAASA